MVNNSTNINKTNNHLSLSNCIKKNKKTPTTYDVENPGHALLQVQKCGGAKPVNGIPTNQSW